MKMPYEMACAGEWFCEEVNAIVLSLALCYLNFCGASFFGVTLMRSNIHYSCLIVSRPLSHNRETTDSYTIAAAPNFESFVRGPSFIYSSFANRSKSNLEIDGKTPFLSGQESITQSTWWEKASVQRITGELPIGYGCSFTQTVFNGMLFHLYLLRHS